MPIVRADVLKIEDEAGAAFRVDCWLVGAASEPCVGVWLAVVVVRLYGTLAAVPGSVAMLPHPPFSSWSERLFAPLKRVELR